MNNYLTSSNHSLVNETQNVIIFTTGQYHMLFHQMN